MPPEHFGVVGVGVGVVDFRQRPPNGVVPAGQRQFGQTPILPPVHSRLFVGLVVLSGGVVVVGRLHTPPSKRVPGGQQFGGLPVMPSGHRQLGGLPRLPAGHFPSPGCVPLDPPSPFPSSVLSGLQTPRAKWVPRGQQFGNVPIGRAPEQTGGGFVPVLPVVPPSPLPSSTLFGRHCQKPFR